METPQIRKQKLCLNVQKIIQPDLLTAEELINILQERGVGPNLLSHSKDKLVALFKNVALPLPQREFRQNYRGSLLMRLRKKSERKKIIVTPIDEENKSFTVGVSEDVKTTKGFSEHKCDRLKPPPELDSSGKKKIRLNSTSQSSSDLDKIVIKKRKTSESTESAVEKKNCENNHKSDTDKCSSNSTGERSNDSCNGSKNSTSKKILLKRNHSTSISVSPASESTQEKSSSEPDKKRKPITWP